MRKPIIGISCGQVLVGSERINSVDSSYIEAITAVGGVPILLPVLDEENTIRMIDIIDGLLLNGGYDIDPYLYGEEPLKELGKVDVSRDLAEKTLILESIERDIPILAICRGIQILNVATGGTLYQDISTQMNTSLKHRQDTIGSTVTHKIKIEKGTKLFDIFGQEELRVNSYHHQAVKDLAPGFRISARSSDGLIEGIESDNNSFIIGIQCHPERLWKKYPIFKKLFQALVNAC